MILRKCRTRRAPLSPLWPRSRPPRPDLPPRRDLSGHNNDNNTWGFQCATPCGPPPRPSARRCVVTGSGGTAPTASRKPSATCSASRPRGTRSSRHHRQAAFPALPDLRQRRARACHRRARVGAPADQQKDAYPLIAGGSLKRVHQVCASLRRARSHGNSIRAISTSKPTSAAALRPRRTTSAFCWMS